MAEFKNKAKLNIGIDFGASKIVIACCMEDKLNPFIVIDECFNKLTPTCLGFINDQKCLASAANVQAKGFPEAVIFGRDIKLVLGEQKIPQFNSIHFPLKIIRDKDLGIAFELDYNETSIKVQPEQVIAMLLIFLRKNVVKQYPDCKIGKCVITVPSVYNKAKVSAMINACVVAGFAESSIEIISSSMAAALTYYMDRYKVQDSKRILIFDMGATTIDYTVVLLKESEMKVELSGGEINLGGDYFTMRLVEHFLTGFDEVERSNIKQDKKAMVCLREACDKLKEKLFYLDEAKSILGSFHNGQDFNLHVTKDSFDNICSDLIDQIFVLLDEIGGKAEKIDEFIVIGGGARIQILQERFKTVFKKFQKGLDEDEAAAIGAAYFATKLGLKSKEFESKLGSLNILQKKCRPKNYDHTKVDYMLQQIAEIEKIENRYQEKATASHNLQKLCSRIKQQVKKLTIGNEIKIKITEMCDSIWKWTDDNRTASLEELQQKHETLTTFYKKQMEPDLFNTLQKKTKTEKKNEIPLTENDLKQNVIVNAKFGIDEKEVELDSDLENHRKKMLSIERLIKEKKYRDALEQLNRIVKFLNEDLGDKDIILSTYIKRAEVYEKLGHSIKALEDYNHLLASTRLISVQKEIEMKRDEIKKKLVNYRVKNTTESCKNMAKDGNHKGAEVNNQIGTLNNMRPAGIYVMFWVVI